MRIFTTLAFLCLFSFSNVLLAQDDPFGADPFAGKPTTKTPRATGQTRADGEPSTKESEETAVRPADPFSGGASRDKSPAKKPTTRVPGNQPPIAISAQAGQKPEQRIRAVLAGPTTQSFVELPLRDAMRQLGEFHDIPIVVDSRALEDLGLSTDVPVTIALKDVTLRSFLRLMLRELDLTYLVKDEVLQITTTEAAEGNLVLESYTFPEALVERSDKVVTALTATVQPQQWSTTGGPCSVVVVDHVLMVSATESVHEDVVEFLQKLQAAFQKHSAEK